MSRRSGSRTASKAHEQSSRGGLVGDGWGTGISKVTDAERTHMGHPGCGEWGALVPERGRQLYESGYSTASLIPSP